jgi:phospholipid/cholesterol/gamma-HCH transport system substrate-binding protein
MISFTERRPWLVGVISIVLLSIGVTLAFSVNRFEALRGVYKISADLKDAAGLQPGNEVRLAGVKVGTVKSIVLTEKAARVELEVQDDLQIPLETRLEVKLKTLLGQKFIELQFPRTYLASVAAEGDPSGVTAGFFGEGDVIPLHQTKIPYEIYQAANEGTAVLAEIDKRAVRRMLDALTHVVGRSKQELRSALSSVDRAGEVLSGKNEEISTLLANLEDVSGTLSDGRGDISGILERATRVLGTLAERRRTIGTLLAATNDLGENLTMLLETAGQPIEEGTEDLNSIMLVLQEELDTIEVALDELPRAQEMFARPLAFGRFIEAHICAVTTEDTCVPFGTPTEPGLPARGTQPEPEHSQNLAAP